MREIEVEVRLFVSVIFAGHLLVFVKIINQPIENDSKQNAIIAKILLARNDLLHKSYLL